MSDPDGPGQGSDRDGPEEVSEQAEPRDVPLGTVAREWGRIGLTGFGGPPTHIALLRRLVVDRRHWIAPRELEDAIAACNLLPGPASTQLAIFCAGRVAGPVGAVVGGLCFIVPAVVMVIALSQLFLEHAPPDWVKGAAAGAGAAVAAVAVRAGWTLLVPSWRNIGVARARRARWIAYVAIGAAGAALIGAYLVLAIVACGLFELALHTRFGRSLQVQTATPVVALLATVAVGGLGALAWVAFKVGALSYGGGFVIIPLMRGDAVNTYHWMTSTQFLNAVALGQVTPGPVVATVAAVGCAADGIPGGIFAAAIAFLPSFVFVLVGGGHFTQLRSDRRAQAFLDGAGPAAIGAILGAAIPLAGSLQERWQAFVLAGAAALLLLARRGIVSTLLLAGCVGAVVGLAGGPLPN